MPPLALILSYKFRYLNVLLRLIVQTLQAMLSVGNLSLRELSILLINRRNRQCLFTFRGCSLVLELWFVSVFYKITQLESVRMGKLLASLCVAVLVSGCGGASATKASNGGVIDAKTGRVMDRVDGKTDRVLDRGVDSVFDKIMDRF